MRKYPILLFVILFCLETYGQEKPVLVFDLINGTLDTLPVVVYDTATLSDKTNYSIGSFNSNTAFLEQTPPVSNTYPNTNFTYKKQASTDFDLTEYPIRTSVKLFFVENDALGDLCSGSLISRRHVLTAAHCVANMNSNSLFLDSIKASPIFDNGTLNSQFNSSYVSKIYIFKDWNIGSDDIAVLELQESLGESTGWISIGFNKIDNILSDGIFYKFTYPATTMPIFDLNEYNGDTLYYNYGGVNIVTNTSIGINNTSGISGESGSSLIKVINQQEYTSYGVLSFSNNLNHSKISNWQFYALENIITNDLTSIHPQDNNETLIVYPNPVINTLYIKNKSTNKIIELMLFDNVGKLVQIIDNFDSNDGIDVSKLKSGVYYLKATTKKHTNTLKIIKN